MRRPRRRPFDACLQAPERHQTRRPRFFVGYSCTILEQELVSGISYNPFPYAPVSVRLTASGAGTPYVHNMHVLIVDDVAPIRERRAWLQADIERCRVRGAAAWLARPRPDTRVRYVSGYVADAIVRRVRLEPGLVFRHRSLTPSALARNMREVP